MCHHYYYYYYFVMMMDVFNFHLFLEAENTKQYIRLIQYERMVIVKPFLDKYHIVKAHSIYPIGIHVQKRWSILQ